MPTHKQPVSRFRNRKINLKVKLPIHVGSFDVLYDDQSDVATPTAHEASGGKKDKQGVETGVDKEEEGEVHLQNAITASAAALTARATSSRAAAAAGSPTSKAAAADVYIPTPDATGIVSDYASLYPQKAFLEPSTLIRFSDTVEDVVGPAYTLDEEDAAFLDRYHAQYGLVRTSTVASPNAQSSDRTMRSPRRDKGKEPAVAATPLSDDDFELIMDHYERYAEERAPMLHLDPTRLPPSAEMEATFVSAENPRLTNLRIFARLVYAHWKERRLKRGGRSIVAQLDFDESREDNPYVCFRRRETKMARKTRRSETNNIERLLRLRADLSQAREVLQVVLEREKAKRELMREEALVFGVRTQLRELKRRSEENDGDNELLIPRERRKRRRVEDAAPSAIMSQSLAASTASLKTTIRLPGRDVSSNALPGPPPFTEPVNAYKDRTITVSSRIDRDMERKRVADREWEDYTDGAYCPLPWSPGSRFFRCPDPVMDKTAAATFAFAQQITHSLGGIRPAFRKRLGRGGRVMLDRVAYTRRPSSVSSADGERWRYDGDVVQDLCGQDAVVIDDYSLESMLHRLDSLRKGDIHGLSAPTAWMEKAGAYVSQEVELLPPVQVSGKLPGRQIAPPAPAPMQPALGLNVTAPVIPPTASAAMNSMILAANHAQQVAQTQGAQLRRIVSAVPNGQPMMPANLAARRPSSSAANGLPALQLGGTGAGRGPDSPVYAGNAAFSVSATMQQMAPASMAPNGLHRSPGLASPATSVAANQRIVPTMHAPRSPAINGMPQSFANGMASVYAAPAPVATRPKRASLPAAG